MSIRNSLANKRARREAKAARPEVNHPKLVRVEKNKYAPTQIETCEEGEGQSGAEDNSAPEPDLEE